MILRRGLLPLSFAVALILGTTPLPSLAQAVQGAIELRGRPAQQAVIELIATGEVPGERAEVDTALIDQRHLRFAPNVLAIAPGTVVAFRNSDPILHNVFSPPRLGADFDLGTYPQDESRMQKFDTAGNYVILCHVHPEMAAWVIVGRTPHVSVADEQGQYVLDNVDPGTYEVRVWYRRRQFDGGSLTVSAGDPTTFDVSLGALIR